jgi:hypothetical protein
MIMYELVKESKFSSNFQGISTLQSVHTFSKLKLPTTLERAKIVMALSL